MAASAHDTPTAPYDVTLATAHHNVLATSTAFSHDCTDFGGAVAGKDGWVFNIPSDEWDQTIGLSIIFSTPGGDVTILIKTGSPDAATYPQSFIPAANPHNATLLVPQGWTLKDGEGKSIGDQDTKFVVTHTCPGTPGESPSPSTSVSTSASASESTSASASSSQSTDPGSPSQSTPPLPRTGTAIISIALSGLVAIGAGAAILFVLRRRRDALMSSGSDE